jgi:hypothetical protein
MPERPPNSHVTKATTPWDDIGIAEELDDDELLRDALKQAERWIEQRSEERRRERKRRE